MQTKAAVKLAPADPTKARRPSSIDALEQQTGRGA
jgi:hypothetical protein